MRPFFVLHDAPLLQNVFFSRQEEARGAARESHTFVHCETCDLAFNPTFREGAVRYDGRYDNDQSGSPRYRAHVAEVAGHLQEACALSPQRRVLEIGCGNGYFLSVVGTLTGATVRGYDPAYGGTYLDPGCVARQEADPAALAADPHAPFDLIVLRHCLEAMPEPLPLLRALAGKLAAVGALFVEITDFQALARAHDFTRLFHEYARYYAPTSLSRLMAQAGLVLSSARPFFEGQYSGCLFRVQAVEAPLALASTRIRAYLARHRRVVLWGASGRAVTFLSHLALGPDVVAHAVDVAAQKQGRFLPVTGQRILSPAEAVAFAPDLVIVANAAYEDEIRERLPPGPAFISLTALQALDETPDA